MVFFEWKGGAEIGWQSPIFARGYEWAGLLLRPFRGLSLVVFTPRVPLRSTLGYDPAPLRGSKALLPLHKSLKLTVLGLAPRARTEVRVYVGPEADAARQEARATSGRLFPPACGM